VPDDTTLEEEKVLRGFIALMLADGYQPTSAEFEVGYIGGEVHRFTATTALRPETPVEKQIRELAKAKKKVGSKTELFISAEEWRN
jgi:hypothetical protein